jgi:hypothetical protein
MGFAQESSQFDSQDQLYEALQKMEQRSVARLQSEYGLSKDFGEVSKEQAMELCERAMETLADTYIQALEGFRDSNDSVEMLRHLEKSEVTWRTEALMIMHFDAEGQEITFLSQMRELALRVMEDKLEEIATRCASNASPENVACCMGVMAVMDHIWGEMDLPVTHPDRQRFRDIAKSFQ